jgi:vanillate monooxygenase ferredoxin subunit
MCGWGHRSLTAHSLTRRSSVYRRSTWLYARDVTAPSIGVLGRPGPRLPRLHSIMIGTKLSCGGENDWSGSSSGNSGYVRGPSNIGRFGWGEGKGMVSVLSEGQDVIAGRADSSFAPRSWLSAVVADRAMVTPRVVVLDLEPVDGELLPNHEAGAHIDVAIDWADGGELFVRQYSLCGMPGDRSRYRIAVLRDEASRGGSVAMHRARIGQRLRISAPRNHFPLTSAGHHLFFAGGIGITPLLAMAQHLDATGGSYSLHYCARNADEVSFSPLVRHHPRTTLHLDDGLAVQKLDLTRDLGAPQTDTAVYVCGPGPFIDYVLDGALALGWPASALYKERFAAATRASEPARGFTVSLASTGAEYHVAPGETILDVLARNDVNTPSSCQQGICGECIVTVLSGQPDHHDDVLTDEERARGLFTPCCSRALSPSLELDL